MSTRDIPNLHTEKPDEEPDELVVLTFSSGYDSVHTYRGEYEVFFNGFHWSVVADRPIPVEFDDELIALESNAVVARGFIYDLAMDVSETEIHVEPPVFA